MSDDKLRARMAQVLQRLYGPSLGAALDWDSEPEKTRQMYLNDADAVIRELPELPVKIVTQDQLDALPFLTVIREVRPLRKGIDYGGIYERRTSGWQCIAGTWVEPERNGPPMLPVMVLWRGKDEQ